MIKRIIFDIDGTLIEGIELLPYIKKSLIKYGINDLNKAKIFLQNIKEYEKIYNCYDQDLYLNFFSNKLSYQLDYYFLDIFFQELKTAIPKDNSNIIKMLSTLKDYELVLLSNFFEVSQRNRLINMGINHFFNEYYGEQITKPNKEAYLKAMGSHSPHECLIVGDNYQLDISIPQKIGLHTIFIHPNGNIKSVAEITPKLIKQLPSYSKSHPCISKQKQ